MSRAGKRLGTKRSRWNKKERKNKQYYLSHQGINTGQRSLPRRKREKSGPEIARRTGGGIQGRTGTCPFRVALAYWREGWRGSVVPRSPLLPPPLPPFRCCHLATRGLGSVDRCGCLPCPCSLRLASGMHHVRDSGDKQTTGARERPAGLRFVVMVRRRARGAQVTFALEGEGEGEGGKGHPTYFV